MTWRFPITNRALTLLGLLAGLGACERPSSMGEHVFSGETQGTTYTIKVCAAQQPVGGEASLRKSIETRLASIDSALSTYRPDSEISKFNAHADLTPFKVSADVIKIFQLANEVSVASGGAFDVTVAPLVKAWGFGPGGRQGGPPPVEELERLRSKVGYGKIKIDPTALTLSKTEPEVTCDLNAIAQGYTVDKIAEDFDASMYSNYMVEVGGEVRTRGLNARGQAWQIGVEKPDSAGHVINLIVRISDNAISTSGDYRNYYEENGVRISHHLDPRTGRPITNTLASVSVINRKCALADAYATALTVLGPEAGYELALKQELPALFIVHSGTESFSEKSTPAFAPFLQP